LSFTGGTLAGKETALLRCGIGKVQAAAGCVTMIQRFEPALIINTGCAGGIPPTALKNSTLATPLFHQSWCSTISILPRSVTRAGRSPGAIRRSTTAMDTQGQKWGERNRPQWSV
jgi:hypothetical protein